MGTGTYTVQFMLTRDAVIYNWRELGKFKKRRYFLAITVEELALSL